MSLSGSRCFATSRASLILARLTRFLLLSWWNTSSETVASLSALRRVVDAFTGLYLGASPKGSVIMGLQHNLGVKGPWKTPLRGKVQGRDFSTALGNPATAARFPLFPPPRLRRVNFPIPLARNEEKRNS